MYVDIDTCVYMHTHLYLYVCINILMYLYENQTLMPRCCSILLQLAFSNNVGNFT